MTSQTRGASSFILFNITLMAIRTYSIKHLQVIIVEQVSYCNTPEVFEIGFKLFQCIKSKTPIREFLLFTLWHRVV